MRWRIASLVLPATATAAPRPRYIVRYQLAPSYTVQLQRWLAASGRAAQRGEYLPMPASLLTTKRIPLYRIDPRSGMPAILVARVAGGDPDDG